MCLNNESTLNFSVTPARESRKNKICWGKGKKMKKKLKVGISVSVGSTKGIFNLMPVSYWSLRNGLNLLLHLFSSSWLVKLAISAGGLESALVQWSQTEDVGDCLHKPHSRQTHMLVATPLLFDTAKTTMSIVIQKLNSTQVLPLNSF